MQKKNDFSQGDLKKTIIRLSLPLILAQMVNVLYSIVDRIYIGQMPGVGATVLAGMGLTFPIITMVSAFSALAGNGGAPLCSIARGEGNDEKAERIMGNSCSLLLFFGVLCTAVGFLVKEPLLWALQASQDTFPYANDYLTIYLTGSVFVMLALGLNPYINAQGFTRRGMASVVIGAAANIVLDPVFIYVLDMGVKGAALATVIAQGLSAAYTISFLTGSKCILRLRFRMMKPDFAIIRRILSLGFSNFTMKLTESAVQLVCNLQLGLYGGDMYITAMTVINSVRQVIMMPMQGLSEGMQPVVGYNYGAKMYDRVKTGIQFMAMVCMGYAFLIWGVTELFPGALIRVFNRDPMLLEVGVPSMRLYFAAFFAMWMQMAGQYSFVSLGKAKQATFFSLLRKAVIVVPLTLILPRFVGVNGVFWAEVVSDLVGSAACFTTFMLTVWRKELGGRRPKEALKKNPS